MANKPPHLHFLRTMMSRACWFLLFAFSTGASHAQNYPAKLVRIVIPAPAGGPSDIITRSLSEKLSESLGQPVIVDNRGGAGGIIGTEYVARAPADGYTLLLGNNATHGINPSLYPRLPYDAIKDFAPISLVALGTNVLAVHPSLPAKSVRELIALAKSQPGKLNFSSAGNGNTSHLAGELFKVLAGVDIVHVPFNGAAAAIVALLRGEVELTIVNIAPLVPHIRSGRLRALGVASAQRSGVLPEVPTLTEAGLKGFEVRTWFGLLAPAGVPGDIITRLNGEVGRIVRLPDIVKRLTPQGADPVSNSPEEFAAFLRAEITQWAKAVKASGARIN